MRPPGPATVLLRSVVGMVPPGASDVDPDVDAAQVLVGVETERGWLVGHFRNTPAAFHGRPEEAEALSAELRAVHAEG